MGTCSRFSVEPAHVKMAGLPRKYSLFIRFASAFQFLITLGILSTLSFSINKTDNIKEGVVGCISAVGCICGYAGAWKLNRSFLQFYLITQMWGLMMCTQYLYQGV